MTMTEERKIRYQIALIQGTKPCNVIIERTEDISETEKNVYATVKGCKIGVRVEGTRAQYCWRVIA